MTICSACGAENRPGRRFCAACGAALELRCAACGAINLPGERFWGECGSARATVLLRAPPARLAADQAHRNGDATAASCCEDEAAELLRSVGASRWLSRIDQAASIAG